MLGRELGDYVRGLHVARGVTFHLERSVTKIDGEAVTLDSGDRLPADVVVAGIGVRPREELAARAGLAVSDGVIVNEYLETSVTGIYAAGDIARYPDPRSGRRVRIEHWVVAERQGQAAARNILGRGAPFTDVPFFWSQHYDTAISYVGHADRWDSVDIEGSVEHGDCTVVYRVEGMIRAVATIGRDRESLRAELAMERGG